MRRKIEKWFYLILGLSIIINVVFVSAMFVNKTPEQVTLAEEDAIDYSFSGIAGDPKTQLIEAINGVTDTLDVAIYNLEDEDIVETILQTKERGVKVRVITDAEKAEKKSQAELLKKLVNAGVEVKVNPTQKMHLKLTIVDSKRVVTGSYNYTEASAYENQELLLTVEDADLAQEWEDIFQQLWISNDYREWEGE
ncbi:phospholipase D-like domain-containing protein [Peribacillus simplex]|uniref:phospholipase D-like domain-containing protein n=1 Tax=Peribacillus simplex TaxID=1478 RepID=UPI003800821F